jgi:hypothetical protein
MMSFTITRNLERVVSYSMLCKLAEQKHVHITGSESNGLFSCRGVEGDYECGTDGIHGKFAGHGVTGEFSFEPGKAAVTIPGPRLRASILKTIATPPWVF